MSNIEEYTKNFKFIIPEFNVATWHTEIKENFKAIDALIANFVQSQQYQGAWKQVTTYEVNDLVYISDEESNYYGYLMRVKVNHTTTGDDFDTFLANNPTYYEVQGEMGAQIAALRAQDWAEKTDGKVIINNVPIDYSAKAYTIGGTGTETNNAKYFKEQAELARDTILEDPGFIAIKADFLGDETIKTVAENIQSVQNIDTNLLSVVTVSTNIEDINTLVSNLAAILTNSENISSINTNATNILDINNVSNNMSDVNAVASDLNNIDDVAEELPDIRTKANKSLDNLNSTGQAVIDSKLDLNLGNITNTSKQTIVKWGMPDYSSGITIASGYVATTNGWIIGVADTGYKYHNMKVNGVTVSSRNSSYFSNGTTDTRMIPIGKGQTFTIENEFTSLKFYPCLGG